MSLDALSQEATNGQSIQARAALTVVRLSVSKERLYGGTQTQESITRQF